MRAGRAAKLLLFALCALCGCEPNVIVGRAPERVVRQDADTGAPIAPEPMPDTGPAPMIEAGPPPMQLPEAGPPVVPVMDAAVDAALPPPPVTWPTGAHPSAELPGFIAFGEWRGRPLDVAHLYSDRWSWQALSEPGWPLDVFREFDEQLAMSVPFFPEAMGGSVAACAAGEYDARWRTFGTFIAGRGRGDMYIRPAWGFNDPSKEWRVGDDPTEWLTCFRRVVDAIRVGAPQVRIVWSFNAYVSPIPAGGNPYDAYPGDDYADVLGVDIYDQDPPSFDDASWEERCNGVAGLCTLMDFAREHGKRVAIGEWGVASCGTNPGGDNPFFVEKMFELFAANSDVMEFESYFDDTGEEVCSSLMNGDLNPKSAAKYKELYGPR